MMPAGEEFPYLPAIAGLSGTLMPLLPVRLGRQGRSLDVLALVDSGASVCTLPYQLGVDLGFDWDTAEEIEGAGGIYAGIATRLVDVSLRFGRFRSVIVSFVWFAVNDVRLILGQTPFFDDFDICFHRTDLKFEIRPKT